MIKIFGAALDPLDTAERLDVKIAYLEWLMAQPTGDDFQDPYDFLQASIRSKYPESREVEWIGKFPIETWLQPKPLVADLEKISQDRYTAFLDGNGCYDYNNKLVDYLRANMNSCVPFMIGVDHCLTGGVVEYLADQHGDFNVLVFDSHCDLIDLETKRGFFGSLLSGLNIPLGDKEIYECGNFLSYLLREGVVKPENLWIMGSQDLDTIRSTSEPLFNKKILPWIKEGMHVLSKEDLLRSGIPDEIKGPTYISFDMDLGSMASVVATRFPTCIGLNKDEFRDVVGQLSRKTRNGDIEIIGLDIMEIDVHLLGADICGSEDHTAEMAAMIMDSLVYNPQAAGNENYEKNV